MSFWYRLKYQRAGILFWFGTMTETKERSRTCWLWFVSLIFHDLWISGVFFLTVECIPIYPCGTKHTEDINASYTAWKLPLRLIRIRYKKSFMSFIYIYAFFLVSVNLHLYIKSWRGWGRWTKFWRLMSINKKALECFHQKLESTELLVSC